VHFVQEGLLQRVHPGRGTNLCPDCGRMTEPAGSKELLQIGIAL
jgi:hypothetical protein